MITDLRLYIVGLTRMVLNPSLCVCHIRVAPDRPILLGCFFGFDLSFLIFLLLFISSFFFSFLIANKSFMQ